MSVKLMSAVFESKLPPTEKLIMLSMADYASDSGDSIFPSIETLARKTSLSSRSIQQNISKLVDKEYLKKLEGGGRNNTNRYKIVVETLLKGAGDSPFPEKKGESGTVKGESDSLKGAGDSPDSSLTISKPSINNEIAFSVATVLSEVTGLSFEINKAQLFKEARTLLKDERISADLIQSIYSENGAWYKLDWRGQRGQPPGLYDIRKTVFVLGDQETIRGSLKDREITKKGGLKVRG